MSYINYPLIGNRIRMARKAKGLTQGELSELINISVSYMSRVENGKTCPNLQRIAEIATILDADLGELVSGSNEADDYLKNDFFRIMKNCNNTERSLVYSIICDVLKNIRGGEK